MAYIIWCNPFKLSFTQSVNYFRFVVANFFLGPGLTSNRYYPTPVRGRLAILYHLLTIFHPRPFLLTRFPPQGTVACVRAESQDYLDIVFRFKELCLIIASRYVCHISQKWMNVHYVVLVERLNSLAGSLCDSLSKLGYCNFMIEDLLHFWFDCKNNVGIYLGSNS